MLTGISENLQDVSDSRKTAVINNEVLRLNVDIATLRETRLVDSGALQEKDYTFYWQGKGSGEHREYGVGFAVRNSLLSMIEPGSNGSERLLTLRLNTTAGPVILVSLYAPTMSPTSDIKDEFYENLAAIISSVPNNEQLVLLGDFNARVGADHDTWPFCLGQFRVGKMNENGQRLLGLCTYHDLCIANSYFRKKPQHKVSWRHPRSKHWHQLDLILFRRAALKNVLHTRSYHSADCNTNHSLVCCKIRLQPKRFHRTKKQGNPHIEVSKMWQPNLMSQFAEAFEKEFDAPQSKVSATEKWEILRYTMHRKKTSKTHDLFDAKSSEMRPVIEAKSTTLMEYKRSPSERNLHILRAARSKVQQAARRCANEYWTQLSPDIQTAAITGNIRGMYDGIKKALGPTQSKTAPLKCSSGEIITDKGQQMERWVEHYSDLYSRENTVSPAALDVIECLPTMDELDSEPSVEELSKAIDSLASVKAPDNDGIPPELIKHCKTTLLLPLHEVLCQCWQEGAVPQDMRDSKIITLYKNKGERNDCNNYRGISLLSIVGKVFARVILIRLQKLAERIYPESQCGFRAERSTIDMVFSLRQLQEKCREQQMPLYTLSLISQRHLIWSAEMAYLRFSQRSVAHPNCRAWSSLSTLTQREQCSSMAAPRSHSRDVSVCEAAPISILIPNVLGQDTEALPVITIDNYKLDAAYQFTYLGSTITDNLSLDAEIDKRIGKAASTLARLTARVWSSPKQSVKTKMAVYKCLCYQHIAVWKRDMDYVCRAGEKAQLIPPEKHPPYPGNILAGQSNQCWCPVLCWSSHYVHPAQTTQTAMVGSCPPYGGWSHSKRYPLRWAGIGEENHRPPSPAI